MTDQSAPTGFEFRGQAGEWFGIWIVNLLLSIVTFGIYSAWAKVRAKKYFYQNTYLDGRSFDYHATGWQILKGRLIVIAALIVFQILMTAIPPLGLLLFLAFIPVFPWLMIRALMFNARQSSFSNVRFDFQGTYWEAVKAYLLYPLLGLVTFYLAMPLADRAGRRFVIGNHRLGQAGFSVDIGIAPFYKAAGFAMLWVIAGAVVAVMVFKGSAIPLDPQPGDAAVLKLVAFGYLAAFIIFLPAVILYAAFVHLALYNAVEMDGGHKLHSTINPWVYTWIVLSNLCVSVITLGLMLPWAQVRLVHYITDHTSATINGSLDGFVAGQIQSGSALGDAYADIEGFDIGVPL